MSEDYETVDTIPVETNRRETIPGGKVGQRFKQWGQKKKSGIMGIKSLKKLTLVLNVKLTARLSNVQDGPSGNPKTNRR